MMIVAHVHSHSPCCGFDNYSYGFFTTETKNELSSHHLHPRLSCRPHIICIASPPPRAPTDGRTSVITNIFRRRPHKFTATSVPTRLAPDTYTTADVAADADAGPSLTTTKFKFSQLAPRSRHLHRPSPPHHTHTHTTTTTTTTMDSSRHVYNTTVPATCLPHTGFAGVWTPATHTSLSAIASPDGDAASHLAALLAAGLAGSDTDPSR